MAVATPTGGTDSASWVRRCYAAALGIVGVAVDLSGTYEEGAEGDRDRDELRKSIAACAVAWWGIACGWGTIEHNHNPGMVPCPSDGGLTDCVEFSADWGTQRVRAFDSLEDGAAEWFAWVRRTSVTVWEDLSQASLLFWRAFDVALSRTPPLWSVAADAFDRVAREVGAEQLASDERRDLEMSWLQLYRVPGTRPTARQPARTSPRPRPTPTAVGARRQGTGRPYGAPAAASGGGGLVWLSLAGFVGRLFGWW